MDHRVICFLLILAYTGWTEGCFGPFTTAETSPPTTTEEAISMGELENLRIAKIYNQTHFKRHCDVYLSRYTIFLGNETAELDEMYQKYLRGQEKYQKEFWCPKVDCSIEGINELCPETCTSGKKRDIYCRLYCYRCYKNTFKS